MSYIIDETYIDKVLSDPKLTRQAVISAARAANILNGDDDSLTVKDSNALDEICHGFGFIRF